MRHNILFIVFAGLLLPAYSVIGQCPVAGFDLPATVCIGENFDLDNTSTGGVRFEWDFCSGDMEATPVSSAPITNGIFNKPSHITVVKDGQNWHGFVVSRFGQKIIRLDYGTDLNNTPSVADLGSFQGAFVQPIDIEFIEENGTWYALLIDVSTHKLWRFVFDNIVDTTPTLQSLNDFNTLGLMDAPVDIEIIDDGNSVVALMTNYNGSKITRADFANSITNAPTGLNIAVPGALNLQGITTLQTCDVWTVLTTSTNNHKVFSLKYTNGINNNPVIAEVVPSGISFSAPMGIDMVVENSSTYAFVQSTAGDVYRLKNAETLTPEGTNLGKLSGFNADNEGLKLVQSGTEWLGFLVNINSNRITRLKFSQTCGNNAPISAEENPTISFDQSGTYRVSLKAYNADGHFSSTSKTISVSANQAPDIAIQLSDIACISTTNAIQGITSDPSSIAAYNWDLGDGNSPSGEIINHQYVSTGIFTVALTIEDASGCHNRVKDNIKIYNDPVSAFTLPSSLICTNGEILFTNNTDDNFDGHLTYEWYVDGDQVSTTRDLRHTFSTTGAKTIKLKTSIPGCFDEKQDVTSDVEAGPAVDFSFSGICEGTATQFTSIIGEINASRDWDFGGGNSSSQPDPSHLFAAAGTYNVSLTALSSSGCNNTKTKTITIRSRPAVNFFVDPPPNSCSNIQTDFINLTTDPVDSDITAWQWNFDDPASPASSDARDPAHNFINAGTYNVALTATTDFGCFRTLQKPIAIAQSPVASIDHSKVCNNLPVNFTSTGTNIFTHYWEMGTSYYEVANPVHTFSTPGDHTVKLVVKGNNLCEATYNKTVSVPEPLVPDFSVTKNCAGIDAIFTDATTGADAVSQQAWDFGGLGSATGSPASFRFVTTGNRNIRLSVTGKSGCSYVATKTISVATAPAAGFTANPETGAAPLSVHFANTSTNATMYAWSFGDGVGTSAQASPDYLFQQTGDFVTTLTATNNEGCESSMSKIVRSVAPLPDVELRIITVSENPDGTLKVIITLQNSGNTILKDLSVYVDISGNVTLREVVQGPIAPSAQHNLILSYGLAPGNVGFLCATADLQNDFAPRDNRICTELNEKTSFITPYPNPVKDILHVEWITPEKTPVNISLVDTFGKKMLDNSVLSAEGLNHYRLDVSGLQSGIYFLIVRDGKAVKTEKIRISPEN